MEYLFLCHWLPDVLDMAQKEFLNTGHVFSFSDVALSIQDFNLILFPGFHFWMEWYPLISCIYCTVLNNSMGKGGIKMQQLPSPLKYSEQ